MKIILTKKQWEEIGRQATWMPNDKFTRDNSPIKASSLITLILKYPKADIVRAIKRLGEESIAGFSGVVEDDVEDIVSMLAESELGEILGILARDSAAVLAMASIFKKIANEGNMEGEQKEPEIRLNPNFDVKKAVTSPESAAMLLSEIILLFPRTFHLFIGLEPSQVTSRVKNSLPFIVDSIKNHAGDKAAQEFITAGPGKLKTYEDTIELLSRAAQMARFYGSSTISDMLGIPPKSRELMDRLHDNAPYMIKPIDIPTEEAVPSEKEQYVNTILDRYNAGELSERDEETIDGLRRK